METKRCPKCCDLKPLSEFHKDARSKDGVQARCKVCQKKIMADWWARNGKEAYKRHAVYQRDWKNQHKDRRSRIATYGHARRKYGVTAQAYADMLVAQNGRCAICGDYAVELDIDHCHVGGVVRELLCNPCNRGLAAFREDPERISAAIKYLKKHSGG